MIKAIFLTLTIFISGGQPVTREFPMPSVEACAHTLVSNLAKPPNKEDFKEFGNLSGFQASCRVMLDEGDPT